MILVMKLRQGPIDCHDCCVWLLPGLVLVNFCWVYEINSVALLFLRISLVACYQK
jgi:hypothetical protein